MATQIETAPDPKVSSINPAGDGSHDRTPAGTLQSQHGPKAGGRASGVVATPSDTAPDPIKSKHWQKQEQRDNDQRQQRVRARVEDRDLQRERDGSVAREDRGG